jgi:O-antigen ligase
MSSGDKVVVSSFALLLPGVLLAISPPKTGLGKRADLAAAVFLGSLLFAFIPQFYWPNSDWRNTAQEAFSIDLPISLSVQPWISFEVWLMVLAGFAWLYATLQWRVNSTGREWLFFWLSLIISAIAVIHIWENLAAARYRGVEDVMVFSFSPNRSQVTNFLAIGGVATFAYAVEGIRRRKLIPFLGVPATILCLIGLITGGSLAGALIYVVGIFCWFIYSLTSRSIPRSFKIGLSIVILAISFVAISNEKTVTRILEFASPDTEIGHEFRVKIYEDVIDMILDAPLTGSGLGVFSAVFPQYRDASANHQQVVHPGSDFFSLASEGGLLAIALFGSFLVAYLARCRGLSQGPSGAYRVFALIAVVIFLLHSMVDVPGHRPGAVYFAILFAALAIPSNGREPSLLKPIYWRVLGGVLITMGILWMISGVFGVPLHSSVRVENYKDEIAASIQVEDFAKAQKSTDDWLALDPMNWRPYFQSAQLTLLGDGNIEDAAADFRRARFVEPIIGNVSYEEGLVWLNIDLDRAISAWRDTLFRELHSKEFTFDQMLKQVSDSPERFERLARLSEMDPFYRSRFLCFLRSEDFMQELQLDLAKDPALSRFSTEERTDILSNWVRRGDANSAEKFLESYGDSLNKSWWVWSLLRKEQADLEGAVEHIRGNIKIPKVQEVELDDATFARLNREFAVAPKDIYKGTILLFAYLERGDYHSAIPVIDGMLESYKPPIYLHYWRAECFYQIDEFIESWYTFETYLKLLWE